MCNLGRKILHQILLAQSYIITRTVYLFFLAVLPPSYDFMIFIFLLLSSFLLQSPKMQISSLDFCCCLLTSCFACPWLSLCSISGLYWFSQHTALSLCDVYPSLIYFSGHCPSCASHSSCSALKPATSGKLSHWCEASWWLSFSLRA